MQVPYVSWKWRTRTCEFHKLEEGIAALEYASSAGCICGVQNSPMQVMQYGWECGMGVCKHDIPGIPYKNRTCGFRKVYVRNVVLVYVTYAWVDEGSAELARASCAGVHSGSAELAYVSFTGCR